MEIINAQKWWLVYQGKRNYDGLFIKEKETMEHINYETTTYSNYNGMESEVSENNLRTKQIKRMVKDSGVIHEA